MNKNLGNSKFIIIHTDGGARGNPGPAAVGFLIKHQSENLIHQQGFYLGKTTNNTAEYQAVIAALTWINKHQHQLSSKNCRFFLDSKLVVNQLKGLYKVKQAHLRNLLTKVRILENSSQINATYNYIPRTQNHQADELVNKVLDARIN